MFLWQVVTEFSQLWSQPCTKDADLECWAGEVQTWLHSVRLNFFLNVLRKKHILNELTSVLTLHSPCNFCHKHSAHTYFMPLLMGLF